MRVHCLIFLLQILLLPLSLSAQVGQPFVTDIPFERSLGEVRVTRMLQAPDRSMLLCTERGIVSFDGASWEVIPTPSPPLTMELTEEGRMFVGMKKGAAELVVSDSGSYMLQPLLPASYQDPIHQIMVTADHILLVNDSRMLGLDIVTGAVAETLEFGERVFSGAFLQFGIPHLLFYQEGLFSYQNGALTRIGNYAKLAENQLMFDLNTASGTYLCFDSGELYLSDGIKFGQVGGELSDFLRGNRVSGGLVLNDTLIAFSTLSGGAVMVHRRDHRILYTLDYGTGLPDNEMTALGRDDNGGLWMAYGSGISRLDMLQPISRYHNYPGLKGVISSSAVLNGELYVGTGNGVFVLKETRDRAEVQRMAQERAEESRQPMPTPKSEPAPRKQDTAEEKKVEEADLITRFQENPSEVKKELSRKEIRELRKAIRQQKKNKGNDDSPEEEDEGKEADEPASEPQKAALHEKKAETPVQQPEAARSGRPARPESASTRSSGKGAVSYVFRPVKGLAHKCRQLAVVNGHLFAATPSGLYVIKGETATQVVKGVYVNHVTASHDGRTPLLATMSGPMRLEKLGEGWKGAWVNDSLRVNVYNVVEMADGTLWAGTDNAAVRYIRGDSGYSVSEFTVDSDRLEHVLVADLDGVPHLLLPEAIYRFESGKLEKTALLGLTGKDRMEFLLGDRGEMWIHVGSEWHVLNGRDAEQLLPYLPIFEDIRHLSLDGSGRLFIVDENREVFSIHRSRSGTGGTPFSVFIRRAMNENRTPFSMGTLTVRPGENSLVFQLSAPFYLKSRATEYQYRVEGLRNSWSQWSSNPVKEIPFLPAGEYVLHVRARNVLGEVSEVSSLPFTVLKPLWQRWYAILSYVLLVVGAVWLIIKAREKSLRETQRELEEKVQERTAELASEKERTEKLLLNILPRETAEELQKRGKATARHYNQVSVLFTDFKGFTRFAESTRPEDLVQELDRCFIAFDDIIEKYHLEKIKTIGDAYMCAGGVPIRNTNNAVAIVLAALEIRDFMLQLQKEKEIRNERFWEIRLGISSGPLTAGVVGKKKFAYDIWGDTVNTASRMESCSEPGKVNISASTYELVKDYFDCTYRGKMDAKGKGEVDMYFVNGIRNEFSENGDGRTPNAALTGIVA